MLKTKLLTVEECKELIAYRDDFSYFCYAIGFELSAQQEEVYKQIREHDYLIFSKYRGGGFSTILLLYALWKAGFNTEQSIMYYCPNKSMIEEANMNFKSLLKASKIDSVIEYGTSKVNTSAKISYLHNFNDTNSKIYMSTYFNPVAKEQTTVIFDEAAYIDADFEELENKSFEKIIVFSNIDDIHDNFWRTLERARNKENDYAVYTCDANDFIEDLNQYKDLPNFKRDFLQMPPSIEQKYRSIYDD
jgi:hypothetical protein